MDPLQFLSLDVPPLLTATFSGVACAILGNYLVLRRLSLMGDAISHSVLPGIVVAFLLTSSRSTIPVFFGAVIAGILSAALIEFVRKYGRVESGASMGVIFSIFFAIGVLLIEQAAARNIDLDADCLLHGQLESIFWYPPSSLSELLTLETMKQLPSEVGTSFVTLLVVILFTIFLYKELKISSFDPALSSSLGFNSSLLHQMLMVMVACAVVASFKAVGSILVIAMIICPAASARLWTDKLLTQLLISILVAVLACTVGYMLGAFAPIWLGYQNSVSASGMMSVMSGVILSVSIVLAPKHGVVARAFRQLRLALRVRREDIIAFLYRAEEASGLKTAKQTSRAKILSAFGADTVTRLSLNLLVSDGSLLKTEGQISLSEQGRHSATEIVRSHRLWESYLVEGMGLKADHVHDTAMELEHFTDLGLAEKLAERLPNPDIDPHGKEIPSSASNEDVE